MIKKNLNPILPRELSANWHIENVLSYEESHIVCTIKSNTVDDTISICKIYRNHCFSAKKYHMLTKLSPKYLLLPSRVITHSGNSYVLFPKEDSLRQILSDTGLSLQQILLLGIDLTFAATDLLHGKCYNIDISPSNIYRRADGKFCLGDLDMEKRTTPGTPDYIAPENIKSMKALSQKLSPHESLPQKLSPQKASPQKLSFLKSSRQSACELSLQYSICRLLENILQLNEELSAIEEVAELLTRGTNNHPEQRFANLSELSEELSLLLDRYSEASFPLVKLTETDPLLFQQKTLPLSHNLWGMASLSKGNLPAAILLLFTGSILIHSILRFEPSHSTGSANEKLASFEYATTSASSEAASEPATENTPAISNSNREDDTTTPVTTSTLNNISASDIMDKTTPSSNSNEPPADDITDPTTLSSPMPDLDIQQKGYYSISTVLQKNKDLTSCTCLYAGENHFTNLDGISEFTNLQELYLNENQLNDISALNQCPHLKVLVLSYNHIKNISTLTKLQSLVYLDLSSNPGFSDLSFLLRMKQLKTLNISGTKLSKKQVRQLSRKLPDCQIIS